MKKSKIFNSVTWLSLLILVIASCAKKDDSSKSSPGDSAPTVTSFAIPNIPVGFFAQNQMMNYYSPTLQNTSYNFQSGMRDVLRLAMGVCDRDHSNGGTADCSAWLQGRNDIVLLSGAAQANSVQLILRSYPTCSYNGCYSWSLPSFSQIFGSMLGINSFNNAGFYDPMVLNMTIWPVNNSQGFELRGYPPAGATFHGGSNLLLRFRVEHGKLDDGEWDFTLYYNETVAATGHMARCQSNNCGL